jgi:hypothetical protein
MPLDNLRKLIDGFKAFDPEKEFSGIVDDKKEELVMLQKEQMLEGRGFDGDWIRPFYSENPFFKSAASALRYAEWKQRITPNPQRPLDVPNLFITGYFHDSIEAKMSGRAFILQPTNSFGEDVVSVHENAMGLDYDKRVTFATAIAMPLFRQRWEAITGTKMKVV